MNAHFSPLLLLLCSCLTWGEPLRLAVAANFKPTLAKITKRYQAKAENPITLSSASTGMLANQIQHGAPFDLFFAADAQRPAMLAGGDNSRTFCYAIGRLALVGGDIADLANPDKSLAIANPVTAPYGKAALTVLSRDQFRFAKTRKLVRANNVAQAYQFWHSGAVDLALLPLSLSGADAQLIPGSWHESIAQHAFIVNASDEVERYLNWFRSDTVRSLITEAGYESCR